MIAIHIVMNATINSLRKRFSVFPIGFNKTNQFCVTTNARVSEVNGLIYRKIFKTQNWTAIESHQNENLCDKKVDLEATHQH